MSEPRRVNGLAGRNGEARARIETRFSISKFVRGAIRDAQHATHDNTDSAANCLSRAGELRRAFGSTAVYVRNERPNMSMNLKWPGKVSCPTPKP